MVYIIYIYSIYIIIIIYTKIVDTQRRCGAVSLLFYTLYTYILYIVCHKTFFFYIIKS